MGKTRESRISVSSVLFASAYCHYVLLLLSRVHCSSNSPNVRIAQSSFASEPCRKPGTREVPRMPWGTRQKKRMSMNASVAVCAAARKSTTTGGRCATAINHLIVPVVQLAESTAPERVPKAAPKRGRSKKDIASRALAGSEPSQGDATDEAAEKAAALAAAEAALMAAKYEFQWAQAAEQEAIIRAKQDDDVA